MDRGPDIPREHLEIFITEAEEQMEVWEERALALEKDPANSVLLNELFRAIHTIKGSAGFVGCDELKDMAHELETTIQDVRDGVQELNAQRMEVLFLSLDATKLCIGGMKEDRKPDVDYDSVIAKIRQCNSGSERIEETPGSLTIFEDVDQPVATNTRTYRLEVDITADENEAFLRGLLIQSKLEDVGEVLDIDPPLEDIRLKGGGFRFHITVKTGQSPDLLRKTADIDQASILSLLDVTENDADSGNGPDALEYAPAEVAPQPAKMGEVVRVHVDKLDSMMNLVGELVVANSRFVSILSEGREKYGDLEILSDLRARTESLAQIAHNLQDTVTRVSMLPVATIFSRFNRVVRDLAKHGEKDVELEVFGEKTEIDKRILDGISEPLIHMLRNAVDHGIEKPQDRVTFGKKATGTVKIGAYQEGDHICLVLSDDGIGIDKQAVVGKAVAKGMIDYQKADSLTDKEVFDLLFTPGFSTAAEVTEISGRGIGLDIVRKTVEELGGNVRMESTFGLGTSTTITLPLTTVIINSLVVGTAGAVFAFPMSSVLEMIRPDRSELTMVQQGRVICLREDIVPVLDLREVLWPQAPAPDVPADDSDQITIIILDYNGGRIGFIVDSLMGKQEIVVKSLSKNYMETQGLIGATIMGTGKVGLILDVNGLLSSYYRDGIGGSDGDDERPIPGFVADEHWLPTMQVAGHLAEEREAPIPSDPAPDETPFQLNPEEAEKMQEVLIDGAINASQSMTELLGREVRVSFPELKIISLDAITESFGGDEAPVAGTFVEFAGDIAGVWAVVMAMEDTLSISDYLMGLPDGSTEEISDTEISALKEMGNILTASFIRAIVDATDLDVHLMVPEISIDMCLAVMDSILVRFNQPGRNILVTEAELFSMETQKEICHLLILMENESTARLVQILTKTIKGLLAKARHWRSRFLTDDEPMVDGG